MGFEVDVKASALKHATNVLRRVNDECVFQIEADGILCRVIDVANTVMTQVTMPSHVFDRYYTIDSYNIGVDLDKMSSILKRASAKDTINIKVDDGVMYFIRGIHRRSMAWLNPDKLRKCPPTPDIARVASVTFSGKEFKEIIAEARDVGDNILCSASSSDGMIWSTESKHIRPDTYECVMPDSVTLSTLDAGARGIYSLDYLHSIAADIKTTDNVVMQFGSDLPCKINYMRDAVMVETIIAPRIESD